MADLPTASPSMSIELLRTWMQRVLQRCGMFAADAEILIARLIEAETRGWGGGVADFRDIVNAMDLGDIDPRARTLTVTKAPAFVLLDGSTGVGQVAATRAMTAAIELARTQGIAAALIRNTQPCGDPRLYAALAGLEGCLGFCTTNSGRARLALGSSLTPWLNPQSQSWAVPTSGGAWLLETVAGSHGNGVLDSFAAMANVAGMALTVGLAGTRLPSEKKKLSPYGCGAEHICIAIDPQVLKAGDAQQKVADEITLRAAELVSAQRVTPDVPADGVSMSLPSLEALKEVAESKRIPLAEGAI